MDQLNRFQLRSRVRQVLRDESYPKEDLNSAINRVIADVNNSGRYRFHQSTSDITLVAGTFSYTRPVTMIADYALVFAPGVTGYEKVLSKGSELIDPFTNGQFIDTNDAPVEYWTWGSTILFDPVPNATAALRTVRIYGHFDLAILNGDLDKPGLPARYHYNVLVYGAAAQVAPAAMVRTAAGTISVQKAYENSFDDMKRSELWEPFKVEQWLGDERFADSANWGNVSSLS